MLLSFSMHKSMSASDTTRGGTSRTTSPLPAVITISPASQHFLHRSPAGCNTHSQGFSASGKTCCNVLFILYSLRYRTSCTTIYQCYARLCCSCLSQVVQESEAPIHKLQLAPRQLSIHSCTKRQTHYPCCNVCDSAQVPWATGVSVRRAEDTLRQVSKATIPEVIVTDKRSKQVIAERCRQGCRGQRPYHIQLNANNQPQPPYFFHMGVAAEGTFQSCPQLLALSGDVLQEALLCDDVNHCLSSMADQRVTSKCGPMVAGGHHICYCLCDQHCSNGQSTYIQKTDMCRTQRRNRLRQSAGLTGHKAGDMKPKNM